MEEQKKQIKIKASDEALKGVYSNAMQVSHTQEEFILDFMNITPPVGILSSRVIVSPGHLKRMIKALEENLKMYEGKYGAITPAEGPKQEMGFNA